MKVQRMLMLLLGSALGWCGPTQALEPAGIKPPAESADLRAKLKSIVIPKLEFEAATISQAVAFLRKRSQELDPDGTGVNIILQLAPAGAAADKARAATPERTITLSLERMPLGEVLRYVCLQANLQYHVDREAVVIADTITPVAEMQTKAYPIRAGTLETIETRKRAQLKDTK